MRRGPCESRSAVTSTDARPSLSVPAFDHSGDSVRTLRSPYDGAELATVPVCDGRDVDRAVHAGVAAMSEPLPRWQRAEILDRAAAALQAEREDFARVVAAESAKPLRHARGEADRAAAPSRFAAAASRTSAGQVVPVDASSAGGGKIAFTLRVPVGVVGAITPFNFPLNLVAHKVAPAIAAGCAIVVKPAGQTPLSSM